MDATTLNTIVGIIGIIVGVIGAIVGIIGWNSITTANNIKNKAKADNGATIQQAQTIHNGMDSYAVIRLSRDTTQEELARLVKEIHLVTKNDLESVVSDQVTPTQQRVENLEQRVDAMPRIFTGDKEPENPKEGDIWLVSPGYQARREK